MKKLTTLLTLAITLLFSGCRELKNLQNYIPITPVVDITTELTETTEYKYEDILYNGIVIPAYTGEPWVYVNNNKPFFTSSELNSKSFEDYAELDELGRCGVANSIIGLDIMPTEERGAIGAVRPSGWHTIKYDCVNGKYLYNRCHLIGFQLAGENANPKNLVTGTRYMNIDGMLDWENMVTNFVKQTGQHVAYRVTPVFINKELVCRGVLMEIQGIEDKSLSYCVFAYNVQPGVAIDYQTGDSWLLGETRVPTEQEELIENLDTYVLNINTKKVHKSTCSSVDRIAEKNKQVFQGTIDDLIIEGFDLCDKCFGE